MADESGGPARDGIGARLKAARERTRLTVLQAAERLHVDPKILEALEAERFEALGAPVYVRGHIRRYADLVGESASELQELYSAGAPAELPDLTRVPKAQRPADTRKLTAPAMVVVVGFAIVGAVWWVLQGLDKTGQPAGQPLPAPPPAQEATQTVQSAQALPEAQVAVATAGAEPVAAGGVSEAPAAPAADVTRPVQVGLSFSADCWVEIYDAQGDQLYFGIGAAETSRRITGTPPLRVLLGNAPAVTLDIDGQTVEIPPFVRRRDVAQFDIDRAGRIARASPQANGG